MEVRLHILREDGIDDFLIVKCQSLEKAEKDYLGKEFEHYFSLKKQTIRFKVITVEEVPDGD